MARNKAKSKRGGSNPAKALKQSAYHGRAALDMSVISTTQSINDIEHLRSKKKRQRKEMADAPYYTYFNHDYWRIVSQPTFASGVKPPESDISPCIEVPWSKPQRSSFQHTAFHSFSDLPLELQGKIWKHSLPSPRVVEMDMFHWGNTTHNDLITSTRIYPKDYLSTREHWNVFKKNYHFLEVQSIRPTIGFNNITLGYVDGGRDTFATSMKDLQQIEAAGTKIDLSRVENLALVLLDDPSLDELDPIWDFATLLCPLLRSFQIILAPRRMPMRQRWEFHRKSPPSQRHLVEVNDALREAEWHFEEIWAFLRQRQEGILLNFVNKAKVFHKQYQTLSETNKAWETISFEVSIMASKRQVEKVEKLDQTWLAPIVPRPYEVKYFTIQPSIWTTRIFIDCLPGTAWCWEDGTLTNGLEGIRDLFAIADEPLAVDEDEAGNGT